MDVLNREILNDLSQESGRFLLSLFMPTHRVGREMQQDPIRFKNLLSSAEQRLTERGLRKPDIEDLLKEAQSLLEDSEFWQHLSDGLVLFISADFLEYYRLPLEFEELLVIADRYHLKPLIPLLSKNGHFYVLALSQKQVRLMEGSLLSIDEIDLEDVPTSLREALWFEDPERQLQFHTGSITPSHAGANPASYHGQGVSEDDAKTDLLRYFQRIDAGLMEVLADEQAPLILAGVDYLIPIYKQANNYPFLIEEAIEGNPDQLDAGDIHQQAWRIVEPIFNEDQLQAMAHFHELYGSSSKLATNRIDTIIPAAHYGRVETLFTALGVQNWGSFDAANNSLEQHQDFQVGDQDLLDLAAVQTLLNGGVVYALDPGDMPDSNPLAAILRYTYDG
jgi:hypothetical protein